MCVKFGAPALIIAISQGSFEGNLWNSTVKFRVFFGIHHIPGMLMSTTKEEMMAYVIRSFEFIEEDLKAQSIKLGKVVETQTYIFDFGDFSVRSIASRAGKRFV